MSEPNNESSRNSGGASTSTNSNASFEDLIARVKKYLTDPTKEDEAQRRLSSLGVKNLSDLLLLQESDVTNLIAPIQFRSLIQSLSTVNAGTSRADDQDVFNLKFEAILTQNQMKRLGGDEMLTAEQRKRIVQTIAGEIVDTAVGPLLENGFLRIAQRLVEQFPVAFGSVHGDASELKEIALGLKDSLLQRAQYVRKELKKRAKKEGFTPEPFSANQEYGLDPSLDLPHALPEGETGQSQERKRLNMLRQFNESSIEWTVVFVLMKETFPSQRKDMNKKLSMEVLIERWPFIGKDIFLKEHFFKLMAVNPDTVSESCNTILPQWIRFFKYQASCQARKRKRSRRANDSGEIEEPDGEEEFDLRSVLRGYNAAGQKCHLATNILCLMVHWRIDFSELFLKFDETTSFDEIQASDRLPDHGKPIIAVLGSNMQLDPRCYIVIEKRILYLDTCNLTEAIHLNLMAYFVFKIAYGPAAHVLEFIQRKLYHIDAEKGSRIERKKGEKGWSHASPNVSAKLTTITKKFLTFLAHYDLD